MDASEGQRYSDEQGSEVSQAPAPSAPAPTKTNGLAVASLVLGITWLYWLGSILALVFGYIAKGQIDRSGRQEGGRGLAVAGIVLGWVGIAILILVIVIGIAALPFLDSLPTETSP